MLGPLIPQGIIPAEWSHVIALLLGMAFGFVLEASGFSSSRRIMGTFFGYDFVVLRVFFTAAITAVVGLLYFDYLGWADFSMMFIIPTYLTSAIIGGIIMGLGFAFGGYCPGTSYCAVAIGKIDAIVYSIGLFAGIFLFSEFFPVLEKIYYGNDLGNLRIYSLLGLSAQMFTFLLILAAIGMFVLAMFVQRKVKKVEY